MPYIIFYSPRKLPVLVLCSLKVGLLNISYQSTFNQVFSLSSCGIHNALKYFDDRNGSLWQERLFGIIVGKYKSHCIVVDGLTYVRTLSTVVGFSVECLDCLGWRGIHPAPRVYPWALASAPTLGHHPSLCLAALFTWRQIVSGQAHCWARNIHIDSQGITFFDLYCRKRNMRILP